MLPKTRVFYLIIVAVLCCNFNLNAQDCSSPASLCQGEAVSDSTAGGLPTPVPGSYCFQTENAVFFSFQTLDENAYPSVDYQDSTATVTLSGLTCNTDLLYGQTVNVAIFTASDPCDDFTYGDPLICETDIDSDQSFFLESLEPSTTYYVIVSGVIGDSPVVNPSDCEFSLEVSGAAVTYDLHPEPTNQFVFQGQAAEFSVSPDFGPYEWTGEALSNNIGAENSATPTGINQSYTYNVETEIEGCEHQAQFAVSVRPAIVVYNVITPNDDGINEYFEIEGITNWPNAQIWIYSRWGQRVYQAINYDNDWDGGDLPAGVYYYVIEINDPEFSSEPYTGSVTIIR